MTQEQIDSSLLPQVTEQDGQTVAVTVCDSMSGGANEIDGMPRRLSLIRWREGVEMRAVYVCQHVGHYKP